MCICRSPRQAGFGSREPFINWKITVRWWSPLPSYISQYQITELPELDILTEAVRSSIYVSRAKHTSTSPSTISAHDSRAKQPCIDKLTNMSGSTVMKTGKGVSYNPNAKSDLSPVSSSDEIFKSSGSEKNATSSGQEKTKAKKEKKEAKKADEQAKKESKKKSKK